MTVKNPVVKDTHLLTLLLPLKNQTNKNQSFLCPQLSRLVEIEHALLLFFLLGL